MDQPGSKPFSPIDLLFKFTSRRSDNATLRSAVQEKVSHRVGDENPNHLSLNHPIVIAFPRLQCDVEILLDLELMGRLWFLLDGRRVRD
jgi:hypothetical protein